MASQTNQTRSHTLVSTYAESNQQETVDNPVNRQRSPTAPSAALKSFLESYPIPFLKTISNDRIAEIFLLISPLIMSKSAILVGSIVPIDDSLQRYLAPCSVLIL